MSTPNTDTQYIALDIAKASHRVQTPFEAFEIANDTGGFAKLLRHIKKHRPEGAATLVVFEASGGYERALAAYLAQRSIPYALVNPARVRDYARSEGILAKTDAIDARLLLRFAQEKRLRPTPPPTAQQARLSELLDRRAQLSEALSREKNRLEKQPLHTQASIRRMIGHLEKEIACIDDELEKLAAANTALQQRHAALTSVTGVGTVTAWHLLAYLGELPHLGRNQAVALAGLAPYNRDSGSMQARRSIHAGRAKVRRCLYMATQSAAVHNPLIKDYVAGLRARGKAYKMAIVAAMRKLLLHLRSILKNHEYSPCF